MSGTRQGGLLARDTNLKKNPNFYADIGAVGGKNGHTGGFAAKVKCACKLVTGQHYYQQCAGHKGGLVSRRTR